jgi:hypothetical protein
VPAVAPVSGALIKGAPEKLADGDGEVDDEGDGEADFEAEGEGDADAEAEIEALGVTEGEADAVADGVGLSEDCELLVGLLNVGSKLPLQFAIKPTRLSKNRCLILGRNLGCILDCISGCILDCVLDCILTLPHSSNF